MTSPTAPSKYVTLNDTLYDYILRQRSGAEDPLLEDLRRETEALGDLARMLISAEQGDFLTLLTRLLGGPRAVGVGTFTRYSSICIARGLAHHGRLFCFDINPEWTAIARRYWEKDGVANRINLEVGDAQQLLPAWEPSGPIDFAFIDADKPGYDAYFEMLLPKMR